MKVRNAQKQTYFKETEQVICFCGTSTGAVFPEKLSVGVRPACQNPDAIYDQNLRFSLPYL